jgi:hypothetical protein
VLPGENEEFQFAQDGGGAGDLDNEVFAEFDQDAGPAYDTSPWSTATDMSQYRPLPMNNDVDRRPRRSTMRFEDLPIRHENDRESGPPLSRRLWAERRLAPFILRRSKRAAEKRAREEEERASRSALVVSRRAKRSQPSPEL